MALAVRQQDRAMRLQPAGSGEALAVKVVAALEQGLAAYRRDRHSFNPKRLQSLGPPLDVLIRMADEMVAALKSQSAKDNEVADRCVLAIGEWKTETRNVQKQLFNLDEKLEVERANQQFLYFDLHKLRGMIDRYQQEMQRLEKVLKWIPFSGGFLYRKKLKVLPTVSKLHATEAQLNASEAFCKRLVRAKSGLQSEMEDLKRFSDLAYLTKKVYDAKFAAIADVILYYRLLRDAVKNIEDNLDFPKALMEKLYAPQVLVSYSGDARQGTLKDALIQLGCDFDQDIRPYLSAPLIDDYDQCIRSSLSASLITWNGNATGGNSEMLCYAILIAAGAFIALVFFNTFFRFWYLMTITR